uniref:Uncharacterized protein n=1 Tax=Setaria digitata TaxID=48799 RepID=A0A915PLM3_9BILA
MAATLTTCAQCVAYNEQLTNKANEVKALQEHVLKLAHKLQDESRRKEEVQERLNDKLTRLNDYAIKVRNLEEQLQSATARRPIGELSRAEVDSIIGRDLERIHSQLIEKDMKIMELNNTILEKESHIIDLQEMCREQEELVQAKAKAFHIIQQKLLERRHQRDSFSPGHAVVRVKPGSSGSPPPVDPSEECSSVTQDTANQDDLDVDDGGSASCLHRKKHRKKVTFDLPPRKEFENGSGQEGEDNITQTIIDLTTENDQLRETIQEMEKCANDVESRFCQLQTKLDEARRDGRNEVLKARASMQGKIRDLEDKVATMNVEHGDKIEHLNASIETLRADREWTLEENARLLKLLNSYKEKLHDAWEALDARQEECKKLHSKLDDDRGLVVRLADDLEEAQQTANILLEQKVSILDDVQRLKEALEAQDQYIELLETDTMIYEEHIGLLRDSLGASKVERRALIRSKAYGAKLKALEQEREQMNRRSNDNRATVLILMRGARDESYCHSTQVPNPQYCHGRVVTVVPDQTVLLSLSHLQSEAHNYTCNYRINMQSNVDSVARRLNLEQQKSGLTANAVGLLLIWPLDSSIDRVGILLSKEQCTELLLEVKRRDCPQGNIISPQKHSSDDEKLHIKALNLKISSLEAEKTVLISRNGELESRLIQLGKNASALSVIAPAAATITPDTVSSSGSAFKPLSTQMMMQLRGENERQTSAVALQCSKPRNIENEYEYGRQQCANIAFNENYYDNNKSLNDMRAELATVREEYSIVQEKIVQMGCVNFELEHKLKDAKGKLGDAEIRARQAEERAEEARQNSLQQEERLKAIEIGFLAKFSDMEKQLHEMKGELALKDEQLKAEAIENSKRSEVMKQWRFAVAEMEAVHIEIRMLEKQLNSEKEAMESKWTEVRTILLGREADISRKTSSVESGGSGEQSTTNQLRQMMETVNGLKNTVNEQAKKIERYRAERRALKLAIRQLQVDKEALTASPVMKSNNEKQHRSRYEMQVIGLQKQRDFMDQEMTLLCNLNNAKDVLIQSIEAKLEILSSEKTELYSMCEGDKEKDKSGHIEQLQRQIRATEQEKSEILSLLEKSNNELQEAQMHKRQLQMEYDQLQSQLQFSLKQKLETISSCPGVHHYAQSGQPQRQMEIVNDVSKDMSVSTELADNEADESLNVEMKIQVERLTVALQQKDIELQKILLDNEGLKMKCAESAAALDLLSDELERRSQEKDDIIEMLQSQHTYLTQTVLQSEKNAKHFSTISASSQTFNTDIEPKRMMQDASTVMEEDKRNGPTVVVQCCEAETMTDFHFSESLHRTVYGGYIDESENCQSPQCTNKSSQLQDNLADDMKQLMILNAELETAVEVLKGEIWTLNEQLKVSLTDREDLSDKLCELSQRHEEEIERARERERDLEEQKDMAERSQRQAALAENESNRRLVEWQEKSAQMESSRVELENAYDQLSEYYQQLQQAYNVLYARVNAFKVDSNTQTTMDSSAFKTTEEIAEKIDHLKGELKQQKEELDVRAVELQHVRNLLREHLCAALKIIRDLREMNLKLLKDLIMETMRIFQFQLKEALEGICSSIERAVVHWLKEKKLKDMEITTAIQQLINGVLIGNFFSQDSSLSAIVNAVNQKFLEREYENAALKNKLSDEGKDKATLKMKIQQGVSEEEELKLRIKELEDLLQITQLSLTEHITRCQQLQAKLDSIGSAADQSSSAAAKCGTDDGDPWNCSTPCTICRELKQTKQPGATSQLQLAILAARLTTKIADNDALFRCNTELAQTNLRLQSEVDELKEQVGRYVASSSSSRFPAVSQHTENIPKQFSNQSFVEEKMESEEGEWEWGMEDSDEKLASSHNPQDAYQQLSLSQQVSRSADANEIPAVRLNEELISQEQNVESLQKKLNAAHEHTRKLEEKNEEMKNNIEKLEQRLKVSECCVELGNKVEQLETELEKKQFEDGEYQRESDDLRKVRKLEVNQATREEFLFLKSQNEQLVGLVEDLKQELDRVKIELQCAKELSENEQVDSEMFQAGLTEELEKQNKKERVGNAEYETERSEGDWVFDMSKHLQVSPGERMQNIPQNEIYFSVPGSIQNSSEEVELWNKNEGILAAPEKESDVIRRDVMSQELEEQQKEIKTKKLEKENRSADHQWKLQQPVIEELTEDYCVTLEVHTEQEVTDQKKKYEYPLNTENGLPEKLKTEVMKKMQGEVALLKQENETLVAQLTKKESFMEEEKTKLKAEVVYLEHQLANRENILGNLKTELMHTQEENSFIRRQLDNYDTQMNELRKVSPELGVQGDTEEVGQDLCQQLIDPQSEIARLKLGLSKMAEQNELLKDGEEKLLDALMISNKKLVKIESENENLRLEIVNLKTLLRKAEESTKKKDHAEKLVMEKANVKMEMHSEGETSSTAVISNLRDSKDYYRMQKEEIKFLSAGRTKPQSHVACPSSEVSCQKSNEIENASSIETSEKRTFDGDSNDDKVRRRKGGGGFRGAEKL